MEEKVAISSQEPAADMPSLPSVVQVVSIAGREFVLVGTAHISRASAALVRAVITHTKPDCVCVELDTRRFQALSQQQRWHELDLKEIIRKRQLSTLLVNLILASYQKKLGGQLGILPGTELLEAITIARAHGIPIALCDRDIRITLQRAWRLAPFFQKLRLVALLLAGLFDTPLLSEDTLRDIQQHDVLTHLLQELGAAFPAMKQVLIDERDQYLAQRIREAKGQRLVVVVGAGHVAGIRQALMAQCQPDLEALTAVPPPSPLWTWGRWSFPILLVAALVGLAWQQGPAVAGQHLRYWILINGIPCALGALGALAHPLTVLTAFLAAPLTSLTPVIGAGYVTALVQAYLRPPRVRELHRVAEDLRTPRKWWQNRLLRIFLAFLLPSLGSLLGTWLGGYRIFASLLTGQ